MDSLLVSPAFLHDQVDFHDNQFDVSPSLGDAYDSFDFQADSAHFPHTPSYNGSYQNSPYSNYSDLPPIDGEDAFALFADNASGISITEEYDPAEYDAPSADALLTTIDDRYMLSQSTHVSVSVTPPAYDQKSPAFLDHSSPASSNGAEDDSRSRASSTSSYMRPASPRLDFTQNFEGLRFDSPNWPSGSLPPGDRRSPPGSKPQSPPQLVIPDSTNSPSGTGTDSPPIINAPDGDGGLMGPQLHIVPATPVSGGGGGVQSVPFQQALVNMQSGGTQNAQQSDVTNWDHHQSPQLAPPSQNPGLANSQFADQSYTYSGSNGEGSSGMSYGGVEASLHLGCANESQQTDHFLLPQGMQRLRSLSDTSSRPPVWDTAPMMNHQGSSAGVDGSRISHDGRRDPGTVNMNDVLPGPSSPSLPPSLQFPSRSIRHPSSAGPHQTSFNQSLQQPALSQHFAFGPQGSNSPSLNYSPPRHDFLTPDLGAVNLRRARSDSSRTHRQVRSEDLRYSTSNPNQGAGGMLFPPPSSAQQEFIRAAAAANTRQYLHPSEPIASIARGHNRRASSGSRERPAGLGAGGWSSAASSARPSPYPSPSASPRPGYGPLPSSSLPEMPLTGALRRPGMMQVEMGMGMPGSGAGADNIPMTVSKVNVTTPSTADASQKRRKQPANFACPVPGCGSTFTRHFNLKGHLRSHAEEKPYGCKWPGCGKGFARQHDCKRHEQLHLNIRPYPCEGCKKNFARMDALNRHLRSEGGADCRKIQDELTLPNPGDMTDMAMSGMSSGGMKPDPDGLWGMGSVMM